MKILIMNGPNLNLLGWREPDIYGHSTMDDCFNDICNSFPTHEFIYFQSNHEGGLIDRLQEAIYEDVDGVALNAGGYTHTSIALADCIRSLPFPVVELHISNVHQRENFRHSSLLASACKGVVCGFGMLSYRLAVEALLYADNEEYGKD